MIPYKTSEETEAGRSIIPHQLQNEAFGFVKLRKNSKIPFEESWQNSPYSYKDIEAWAAQGFNYGIIGGCGDLIIIDADTLELNHLVKERLPNTFTVKTSREGHHYYYICKDIKKKIVLKKENAHYGEVISSGSQVVGPGSIHPDTGIGYEVINDIEIATISREELYSELIEYITPDLPQKDTEKEIGISVVEVLNKHGIHTKQIGDQLVSGHPVHGSTNNNNFVVHPGKNVWHCFRCNSGGGALSLIAVLEGIITCHEAVSGGLSGNKFSEVLRIARDKYGFDIESRSSSKANALLPDNKLTDIETRIKTIPPDTPPVKIPYLLDPILKEIAKLNIAQRDALLKYTIKEHFNFTNDDLKSYERVLKDYRKEPEKSQARKSSNKAELVKTLQEEEKTKPIHPAQDYADGIMIFTVKIKDTACLITSDGRLFSLEDSSEEGFIVKHNGVDTARFSAKGIRGFLESDYEVNISSLYHKIHSYIKRFIHFPDEAYLTYVTLWIMGTYVFMLFRYYPYVWLNAEKGSGKTLLMEILSAIAFNGELITSPTESVIFRDISNNLITMFIDEVEDLRKRDKDIYSSIISILNSGCNKAGVVKRSESNGRGSFVVKSYTAYSPKMFAGINEIDDVLQDRTVRIPLLRKKDNEVVQRYKETQEIIELQRSIRDDLYIFALNHAKDIVEHYHKEIPGSIENMSHLSNRELDIWEPIFLLANLVDVHSGTAELIGMMESLSRKSLDEKQLDNVTQNETYKILTVLKAMIDEISPLSEDGDIRIFEAGRVLEYFKSNEEFDWIQKTNVLTRRLKKVKVTSDQRRIGGEKRRVYIMNIREFIDLCERFKI